MSATRETLGFQAEVKQLLNLMIHSLYSNKEIFLRELISNASDACDKLRFEALADPALYESDPDLRIRVSYDPAARTVTISDNGIGMSRQEVIDNVGTIAKSGTREFFERLTGDQAKDAHLIGQFGVGFYSSFIVADRVTLATRRAGLTAEHGVRWESGGEGDYTVETVHKADRGTEVTLHLREGEDELLGGDRLRGIIHRYSDHISLPILMSREEWDQDARRYRPSGEDETVNRASALWTRPKGDISAEQHEEFYKHVAHDFEPPLAHVHARVEGRHEYTLLLYLPSHAPFDLWDSDARHGVKLYVRRVFIMEDGQRLLPRYLRFVRGVIDSNDLPLNVSREILQESRDVEAIRGGAVKRVLGMIEDLAKDDPDKFAAFWREFGRVFKEGVGEDPANGERVAALCRFASTREDTDAQTVSLDDYIGRMKEGQEAIYYVTADSFPAARNSPHLEFCRAKGVEVLLLSDRVDEWLAANLHEYKGKALVSVARGELDLGKLEDSADREARDQKAGELGPLAKRIREALGERVKEVRATHRLSESPACLVADEQDMGRNLARLLKLAGQKVPEVRPILEVNPRHPIVQRLGGIAEGAEQDANFADWCRLLYEQALLAEGGQLEDPAGFVKLVNRLMLEPAASPASGDA